MVLNRQLLVGFMQDCEVVFENTGLDSFIEYCNYVFKKGTLSRVEIIAAAIRYSGLDLSKAAKLLDISPKDLDVEANKYGLL